MYVFITGACGGLGQALIQRLSELNHVIIATDIHQQYNFSQKNVQYYPLDVSNHSEWEKLLNTIYQKHHIDVLINLAAIIQPRYVFDFTEKEITKQIDINLKGLIYGTYLVAKKMKETQNGHIINISSLAGIAPIPGISLYSATKFAVRAFSLAIALELKPYNVYVSVICPDAIKTPMLDYQKDFIEAALSFSNFYYLTPEYVSKVILKTMKTKELEVIIPMYRGLLAKVVSAFPSSSKILFPLIRNLGIYYQKKFRRQKS
ncbi:MAG: SDR family NAD(P)-dependent oxidoreductase [Leptospiraceae bacterium]|nr:SDR family NAD(P)-dependent oxidoreductase [Leptospiraceae bacterium]MDW7975465.1 SDR family NAD(P)-dependent oxidoreductase [Leptospiraceae bacterium]